MIKRMEVSKFAQALSETDLDSVLARKNNNIKLLPYDSWALKLMKIGGCKLPRRKKNPRILTELKVTN